ncbi:MAG: hypothetical protein KDB27_00125 [Planctomycetales bacterium]|nr:hypothetical protein [Planctomycetales bacterium]
MTDTRTRRSQISIRDLFLLTASAGAAIQFFRQVPQVNPSIAGLFAMVCLGACSIHLCCWSRFATQSLRGMIRGVFYGWIGFVAGLVAAHYTGLRSDWSIGLMMYVCAVLGAITGGWMTRRRANIRRKEIEERKQAELT